MRKFDNGHRVRTWIMLGAAVLVALATFYGASRASGWPAVLAAVLVVGLFSVSLWMFARTWQRREKDLLYYALHDPLTDLPNRSSLLEQAESALGQAARESSSIAVLLVDLDDFEEVNHGLGDEAGDRLLTIVGERLQASVRPGGFVARLCGDEFAILLEDVADRGSAVSAARRIEETLGAPIELNGSEVLVSASVGVAIGGPEQEDGPEDLLRNADVAMHAAKRKGKARFKVFDPDASSTTSRRSLTEAEMRRAFKEEEFLVYYQPVVALETGKVHGVEALVRWQHPVYGLIPPAEFVPAAEQTGLIALIGQRVLHEACRQVRLWQEEYPSDPPLTLSVNVSARQFRLPNLTEEILGTLEKTGLNPHHLKLEITESVMVNDALAIAALRKLKNSGIEFAMDDFGTGYSNLSYVKRLPIDTLKIDRTYVRGLGTHVEDKAIVHATVAFAEALGLKVVAEGIETAEQMTLLRELGCELGQGYHFAKPLPSEEMTVYLGGHLRRSPTTGSG
jgi:diguanylate cyclase (GGDEF)-like protein